MRVIARQKGKKCNKYAPFSPNRKINVMVGRDAVRSTRAYCWKATMEERGGQTDKLRGKRRLWYLCDWGTRGEA